MWKNVLNQIIRVHESHDPFEKVNIFGIYGKTKRQFQVIFCYTIFYCNINYLFVLTLLRVIKLLLATLDVFFDALVDENFDEVCM